MIKSFLEKINKHEWIFIGVLLLYSIARSIYWCFPDNDLWTRLIVGNSVIEGFRIMKHDIFSYLPTNIWYDHEWGSSTIIYGFFKIFGTSGILILKSLLMFLIVFLIFKTIKLKHPQNANPYNILFYFMVLMASAYVLGGTIRCHMFTFLFFTLFIFILEKVRLQNFKYWQILPIIMLFWSNMHGGCVSGLGLIVMYLIGEALNKKPIAIYIKALLTSSLVLFVNPYGIGYVVFLLHATTMSRRLIVEWYNTFFDNNPLSFIWFKTYLYIIGTAGIFTFIKGIIKKENFDKTKWIVILTTLYLAISHIKHQPFFVIASAIFLYDDLYFVLSRIYKFIIYKIPKMTSETENRLVNIKDIVTYIFIAWLSIGMLNEVHKTSAISISGSSYPYSAIEFIKINKLHGNLYTNFDWGSYATYKLFPYNKIAMDGRYEECFEPKLIEEMNNFLFLKDNSENNIMETYPPDIMVIEKKYPVYNTMLNKNGWFLVFEDDLNGVFITEKLKKDKYIYPTTDFNYYDKTMFDMNFSFQKSIKKQ